MELGQRIKLKRNEKGMSLRDLSDLINIDKAHLSRIENNKKTPSIETLESMAKVFDVPISFFFGESVHLPSELEELGVEWITVTKEAKANKLTPDELRQAIQFVKNIRK